MSEWWRQQANYKFNYFWRVWKCLSLQRSNRTLPHSHQGSKKIKERNKNYYSLIYLDFLQLARHCYIYTLHSVNPASLKINAYIKGIQFLFEVVPTYKTSFLDLLMWRFMRALMSEKEIWKTYCLILEWFYRCIHI